MSINHYSSEIPETQWWSLHHRATMDSSPKTTSSSSSNNHHHKASDDNSASFWLSPHQLYSTASAGGAMFCRQNAAAAGGFDLNNNNEDEDGDAVTTKDSVVEKSELGGIIPKDRLFEKPLTPSDVGKLNRLVIPKQHAEKHFPLNGGGGDSGESGLLLGFEDEVGKAWRFRYSYWNSSQSYVLTKGWSRFVKEKRLDAGDIVVFARHRVDSGRLFIGWRRRNSTAAAGQDAAAASQPAAPSSGTPSGGAGGVWNRAAAFYSAQPYPISRGQYQITPSSPLPNHSLHPGIYIPIYTYKKHISIFMYVCTGRCYIFLQMQTTDAWHSCNTSVFVSCVCVCLFVSHALDVRVVHTSIHLPNFQLNFLQYMYRDICSF
ncbi:hypothetical protein ABFS82_10G057900 [Erythranthe guttata]